MMPRKLNQVKKKTRPVVQVEKKPKRLQDIGLVYIMMSIYIYIYAICSESPTTIFYRLVSKPRFFLRKSLSSSKRNQHFSLVVDFQGMHIYIYIASYQNTDSRLVP